MPEVLKRQKPCLVLARLNAGHVTISTGAALTSGDDVCFSKDERPFWRSSDVTDGIPSCRSRIQEGERCARERARVIGQPELTLRPRAPQCAVDFRIACRNAATRAASGTPATCVLSTTAQIGLEW